jgi:hypothetical protein
VLADLENTVRLLEVVSVPQRECFALVFGFNHHVFHPAQLDDVARL